MIKWIAKRLGYIEEEQFDRLVEVLKSEKAAHAELLSSYETLVKEKDWLHVRLDEQETENRVLLGDYDHLREENLTLRKKQSNLKGQVTKLKKRLED